MSENELIEKTSELKTRGSISRDLKKLGLKKGMVVLVHSSLSSLGWVNGGEVAVIQALMDVVTKSGTIIMPTQTSNYSNPKLWENPPVPKSWVKDIKETMPAYNPDITPTRGMGVIAETFRKFPNVLRSSHPQCSFAAFGKYAEDIIKDHSLNNSLGEKSPLARIYDLDGWILFLGVGHESNTSFHLSEYRAKTSKPCTREAPIIENGKRTWKIYKDIEFNEEVFSEIGKDFEKSNKISKGLVGCAESKLFKQKEAVDFAEKWLNGGK